MALVAAVRDHLRISGRAVRNDRAGRLLPAWDVARLDAALRQAVDADALRVAERGDADGRVLVLEPVDH